MHCLWTCQRGTFPLRLIEQLGLQWRSWSFSTMRASHIFIWGQAWNQLLLVLRHSVSSHFPSKHYFQMFSFLAPPSVCKAWSYIYRFGLDSVLVSAIFSPNKIISFWVGLVFSGVFGVPFGEAVRISAYCSLRILVRGILGLLFIEGGCQNNYHWLGILSLRIPNSSGFIVSI